MKNRLNSHARTPEEARRPPRVVGQIVIDLLAAPTVGLVPGPVRVRGVEPVLPAEIVAQFLAHSGLSLMYEQGKTEGREEGPESGIVVVGAEVLKGAKGLNRKQ